MSDYFDVNDFVRSIDSNYGYNDDYADGFAPELDKAIWESCITVKEIIGVLEKIEFGSGISKDQIVKAELLVIKNFQNLEEIDEFATKFEGVDKLVLLRACAEKLNPEDFAKFYHKHKKDIWQKEPTLIDLQGHRMDIEQFGVKKSYFDYGNGEVVDILNYVKSSYKIAGRKMNQQENKNSDSADIVLLTGLDIVLHDPYGGDAISKAKAFITRNKDHFSESGLDYARVIVQNRVEEMEQKIKY